MTAASRLLAAAALGLAATACGSGAAVPQGGAPPADLTVAVQNSTLLVGADRLGIALIGPAKQPILGARVLVDLSPAGRSVFERRSLQFIGSNYGQIPVYLGVASFPSTGSYRLAVTATLTDGSVRTGTADVQVTDRSPELPVGHSVTEARNLRQRVARDVRGDLSQIDSAVKDGRPDPDPFHQSTIQDGLDMHRPMVLYFGQPGRCVSETCGPTVALLEKLSAGYGDRMLFEHIEVHDPAPSETFNPTMVGFGLTSEPWVYFVNAQGIVADRFEGPVTIEQLRAAADGTLAGRVPAVDVTTAGG